MATTDKMALWVAWTRDAARNYAIPEEIDNMDELVDDMCDVATAYADEMLDRLEERFDTSGREKRRERDREREGGRRRRSSDDAPESPESEED